MSKHYEGRPLEEKRGSYSGVKVCKEGIPNIKIINYPATKKVECEIDIQIQEGAENWT